MNATKDITAEVATLGRMTVLQLRERYQQLHGEPTGCLLVTATASHQT